MVPFPDARWELDFFDDYREAARRWAGWATIAAAGLYATMLAVVQLSEPYGAAAIIVRVCITVSLGIVALLLLLKQQFAKRYFVPIVGSASICGLGGLVVLYLIPHSGEVPRVLQAGPGFVFGLLVHYAFLRLPLVVAATIGWVLSIVAWYTVPIVIGGNEDVREAIYLAFTNIVGMIISRLTEVRERELFRLRRVAELACVEAAMRQATAEDANRQKTRLMAAVSHDLRQPMTAAIAYVDLARNRVAERREQQALQALASAHAAVTALGRTLDHLLTVAQYDSGNEGTQIERITLVPVLSELIAEFEPDARTLGVRVNVRVPRVPLFVESDALSLQRVLRNLVSNAVKYCAASPEWRRVVLIAPRLTGSGVRIDVWDRGVGIEQQDLPKIWEPFVQLDKLERDRQNGLGLGLYLVARIVSQLEGHRVSVASKRGKGSRFTLWLPGGRLDSRIRNDSQEQAVSNVIGRAPCFHGTYLMLIEDDRDVREALAALLESWGSTVVAAASLPELLDRHGDCELLVDAIVCDYRLQSGLTGVSAVKEIRAKLGYCPGAVVLSGEADVDSVVNEADGTATVLCKPLLPMVLADALVGAISEPRGVTGDV